MQFVGERNNEWKILKRQGQQALLYFTNKSSSKCRNWYDGKLNNKAPLKVKLVQ